MPYIKKEKRDTLLNLTINELKGLDLSAGDLNFLISTLIWNIFNKDKKYSIANMLIGVLEAVKLETYRRLIGPFEDLKRDENGDLL